jgi:hypothetical protein
MLAESTRNQGKKVSVTKNVGFEYSERKYHSFNNFWGLSPELYTCLAKTLQLKLLQSLISLKFFFCPGKIRETPSQKQNCKQKDRDVAKVVFV